MSAEPIYATIGRRIEVAVTWLFRLLVAFVAGSATVALVVAAYFEANPLLVGFAIFPLYLFIGMLWPNNLGRATGWLGRQLSKPHNNIFVPYVAEPIERAAEWLFAIVSRLLKVGLVAVLGLVAIIVAIVIGALLFKGVAALPVSVAVIIGAVIIASALSNR